MAETATYGILTASAVGILTDQQAGLFDLVNFVIISSTIGWFGIAANVTNIIVFFRQGFTNTVNISLFSLGLADLFLLVTLQWICICRNPLVIEAGAPWVLSDFMNLTAAWPHVVCGRISSFITVYITAERCLCIIAPLKVKHMITPLRATIAMFIIFFVNIITLIPEYVTSFLEWKYYPENNRTLLSISYREGREHVEGLVFFLSSIFGILSFGAVIVLTVILVYKLKNVSKWRQKATYSNIEGKFMSSRDRKTVKMVVTIASVLIVCYFPGTTLTLTTFIEPQFNLRRRYINLAIALWSVAFVFQTVNSSVNIFLYYLMSSNYRHTFDDMFDRCHTKSKLQVGIKFHASQ